MRDYILNDFNCEVLCIFKLEKYVCIYKSYKSNNYS